MTQLKIIIVDDEHPARNRLRELLEDCRGELPHRVAGEAANGVEGLKAVAAAEADVVLVDIQMPEMSEKAASGARLARGVLESIDPAPRRYFSVAERGRVTLVPVSEVIYLRAELKYVTLRTREREHLVEESLQQLEREFGGVFVRIHRNCLVARRLIRGVEQGAETEGEIGWSVILEGCEEKLPVSRRQWAQVKSLVT